MKSTRDPPPSRPSEEQAAVCGAGCYCWRLLVARLLRGHRVQPVGALVLIDPPCPAGRAAPVGQLSPAGGRQWVHLAVRLP